MKLRAALALFLASLVASSPAFAGWGGNGWSGSGGGGSSTVNTSSPVSGDGSVGTPITIAAGTLPISAIANFPGLTLLGRSANSTGAPASITCSNANGLFFATAASGANTVTCRAILAADIPDLSSTYAPTSFTLTCGTGLSGCGNLTANRTLTNTGVTSNIAGTAISVSSGTGAVTITNTGVTSAVAGTGVGVSGATGAVTFSNTGVTSNVAGSGISVSGATGAVTIGNTGVTSAVAGTGITVSGATGAVTFTNAVTQAQVMTALAGVSQEWAFLNAAQAAVTISNAFVLWDDFDRGVTSAAIAADQAGGAGFYAGAISGGTWAQDGLHTIKITTGTGASGQLDLWWGSLAGDLSTLPNVFPGGSGASFYVTWRMKMDHTPSAADQLFGPGWGNNYAGFVSLIGGSTTKFAFIPETGPTLTSTISIDTSWHTFVLKRVAGTTTTSFAVDGETFVTGNSYASADRAMKFFGRAGANGGAVNYGCSIDYLGLYGPRQ